ncbi:MAG: 4Fe-4S binding protein [Eubacterium sp.]|nr:4Fe-4S binding protein [Eubacterium sp.]
MIEDKEGFEYPQVDKSKCIKCYLCLKVCPFNETKKTL